MQPAILALDEPTSGLDPQERRHLIELLAELPQTMLVANDLHLVEQLLPRTVVMDEGRVIADDSSEEILNNETLLFQHGLK